MTALQPQQPKMSQKKPKGKGPVDPFDGLDPNQISRVKQVQKALLNNSPTVDIILLYLHENKNNVDHAVLSILEATDNHTAWIGQDRPPKKQQQKQQQQLQHESHGVPSNGRRDTHETTTTNRGARGSTKPLGSNKLVNSDQQQNREGRSQNHENRRGSTTRVSNSNPGSRILPHEKKIDSAVVVSSETASPHDRRGRRARTHEKPSSVPISRETGKPLHHPSSTKGSVISSSGPTTQTVGVSTTTTNAATVINVTDTPAAVTITKISTFTTSTKVGDADARPKSFVDALKGIKPVVVPTPPTINNNEEPARIDPTSFDSSSAANNTDAGSQSINNAIQTGRSRGGSRQSGSVKSSKKQQAASSDSPTNNAADIHVPQEIQNEIPTQDHFSFSQSSKKSRKHHVVLSGMSEVPLVTPATAQHNLATTPHESSKSVVQHSKDLTRTIALRVPAHIANALMQPSNGISNVLSTNSTIASPFDDYEHNATDACGAEMNRGNIHAGRADLPFTTFQLGSHASSPQSSTLMERIQHAYDSPNHPDTSSIPTSHFHDPASGTMLSHLFANSMGIGINNIALPWHFSSGYRSPAVDAPLLTSKYTSGGSTTQHADAWIKSTVSGADVNTVDTTRSSTPSVKSMSDAGVPSNEKYHNVGNASRTTSHGAPHGVLSTSDHPRGATVDPSGATYGVSYPSNAQPSQIQQRTRPPSASSNYQANQPRNMPTAGNFSQRGAHPHGGNAGATPTNFYVHGAPIDGPTNPPSVTQTQPHSHNAHFISQPQKQSGGILPHATASHTNPGSGSDGMHHAFASHGYQNPAHRYPMNYVANGTSGRTSTNKSTSVTANGQVNSNAGNGSIDTPPAWGVYHTIDNDGNTGNVHDPSSYRGTPSGFNSANRTNNSKQHNMSTQQQSRIPAQPAPFSNPFLSTSNPNTFVNSGSNVSSNMMHGGVEGTHGMFNSNVPVGRNNKPVSPPSRQKHQPYMNVQSSYSVVGDTARQLSESEWNMNQTNYK